MIPISWLHQVKGVLEGAPPQEQAAGADVPVPAQEQVGFRDLRLSIPEAIALLEEKLGSTVEVKWVVPVRTAERRMAYDITLANDTHHVVDAVSGAMLEISQARAQAIAQAAVPGGEVVERAFLKETEPHYWGRVPAYKFAFNDGDGSIVYVSSVTGSVEQVSTRLVRLRNWVISWHEFEPLLVLWNNAAFQRALLLLVSAFGIVVVLTGFYIALPVRRQRSRSGRKHPAAAQRSSASASEPSA